MATDPNYEEPILTALRRITRAIDLYSRRLAKEHTLTAPQLICLRALSRHEGMTLGELAESISLSPATVTGILSRLEARGLVTRRRSSSDRRRVRSFVTAEGLGLIARAPRPLQEAFSHRLQQLPPDDRRDILRALEAIVEMMGAEELDVAPVLEGGGASLDGVDR